MIIPHCLHLHTALRFTLISFSSFIMNFYSLLNSGQSMIINAGVLVGMVLAAIRTTNGEMTTGDFVMINAYILQLYAPLNWLGTAYRTTSQVTTPLGNKLRRDLVFSAFFNTSEFVVIFFGGLF